jgi:pyochelin biosynthetic protein PchC
VETYRYEPGPALGCPVVVLTDDQDPQVTCDEARAWREHSTGAFELRRFLGRHCGTTNSARWWRDRETTA